MIDLGKFVINTSITLPFDIGDFTSWYTDKTDIYYPGIRMNLVTSVAPTEFLTFWLVKETDPKTIRDLDQLAMHSVEESR